MGIKVRFVDQVAHEGNPRETPVLTVEGVLDGDTNLDLLGPGGDQGVPVADLPDDGNSDCPGCESFIYSEFDQDAFDACHSDEGDGVVTVSGDCAFLGEPDCTNLCTDYYGDFRFGLNAVAEGDQTSQPFYWETDPIWITPAGTVTCDSSCGTAVLSKQFQYDTGYFELIAEGGPTQANITPSVTLSTLETLESRTAGNDGKRVYQLAACNVDVDCFTPCLEPGVDLPLNNGVGLVFSADFVEEEGSPIVALAILTDDGTGTTITGFGVVIDRVAGLAKTVQWDDAPHAGFAVLDSGNYVPSASDSIRINAQLTCRDGSDPTSSTVSLDIAPEFGRVQAICGSGGYSFESDHDQLERAQWEDLSHAVIIILPTTAEGCGHTMTLRQVTAIFQRFTE